jgi:hypothetical protein
MPRGPASDDWWVEIGAEDEEGEFEEIARLDLDEAAFRDAYGLTFRERSDLAAPVERRYVTIELRSGRQYRLSCEPSAARGPLWVAGWSELAQAGDELDRALKLDPHDYLWVKRAGRWLTVSTGQEVFPQRRLKAVLRITVDLRFRTTEAGGRTGAISTDYRALAWFGEHRNGNRLYHDVLFYFRDGHDAYRRAGGLWMAPGGRCIADAIPVYPEYARELVAPGGSFEVSESHHVTADATVVEVVADDKPS